MKESNFTFLEWFTSNNAKKAEKKWNPFNAFDWDKAAEIIKNNLLVYTDLVAEAGLQWDWDYTWWIIFEEWKPTNDNYTYLCSNWAIPTLLLFSNWDEIEEIKCFTEENERFGSSTKWDNESLKILWISI